MSLARRTSESELAAPPRDAGPDRDGLREIAVAAALGVAGLAAAWAFAAAEERPAWLWGVFAIFAALGVYLAYRFAGVWKTRLRLVREGVAADGVVIRKTPEPKGQSHYVVWYTAADQQWSVEGSGVHSLADVGDARQGRYRNQGQHNAYQFHWRISVADCL